MPQERGDLLRPTGPQEFGLPKRRDRCIRCSCSGLDRNQAETKLLEETFVPLASRATEFLEARLDRGLLGPVFDSQRVDVAKGRLQGFCHPVADHKTGGNLERNDRGTPLPAARLNNRIRYEATMSLLYLLARWLDRISPAPIAYAHCDIPCGIYDPHHAQLAAHTVVRMVDLINQLEKPGASSTPEQRQEYTNKLTRYIATKEQHSEIAKNEVRILWGDYFKPEHLKTFPELHELVWKALKSGSKARQEINLQAAEDLLKATNDIASIFWKTKGFETITAKAPYPTERLTVYPKFK